MRILLIDDDPIIRECVESWVHKSNRSVLLRAASLDAGVALVAGEEVDLALIGLEFEALSVVELGKRFHAACEHIPFVILAGSEQVEIVLAALTAGAMGYINKNTSSLALRRALEDVLAGRTYVPLKVVEAAGLLNLPRHSKQYLVVSELTGRAVMSQRGVVARLLRQGRSNRTMASELRISEATVRQEVNVLLKALAVTSRMEAMLVFAAVTHSSRRLSD